MSTPDLMTMMRGLIAAPSVSSVNSAWDQSNAQVIDLLARWLDTLGFACERLAVPGWPGKFNLVASRGSGPDPSLFELPISDIPAVTPHPGY